MEIEERKARTQAKAGGVSEGWTLDDVHVRGFSFAILLFAVGNFIEISKIPQRSDFERSD